MLEYFIFYNKIAEKVIRKKTVNIEANIAGGMYSGAYVHQGRMYSRNIIHQVPDEEANTNSNQGQRKNSTRSKMLKYGFGNLSLAGIMDYSFVALVNGEKYFKLKIQNNNIN